MSFHSSRGRGQTFQPLLLSPTAASLPTATAGPPETADTALDGKKLRYQQLPGGESGQWKKKRRMPKNGESLKHPGEHTTLRKLSVQGCGPG